MINGEIMWGGRGRSGEERKNKRRGKVRIKKEEG